MGKLLSSVSINVIIHNPLNSDISFGCIASSKLKTTGPWFLENLYMVSEIKLALYAYQLADFVLEADGNYGLEGVGTWFSLVFQLIMWQNW